MRTVFIFHGVYGHPKENWFDWLKLQLEREGWNVIVPQFPTPKDQTLENWLRVFEDYRNLLTQESIIIAHSLGVAFALQIIEQYPVKAAFFVAGFTSSTGNKFDESMKSFTQRTFAWEAIQRHCPRFYVFHADNDPYVPLKKATELANHLNVQVTLVNNAGHFNEASGYTTFPLLLESILKA
ncbi:serine hydrolase family protein [Candidatus Woesearchaeota archaeon]|nr:serine hydrolase family protein [Candidatus Woesearchaeota archaeon]